MPSTFPLALTSDGAGTILAVRVIPRARRTAIAGTRHGSLLVRLAAAPVDGAANAALADVLADALGLPRRAVTIVTGTHQRDKRVRLGGLSHGEARQRLSAILNAA